MTDEARAGEPRTEAGRHFDHQWPGGTRIGRDQWRQYVLDIEREAAGSAHAPALDVERLTLAMVRALRGEETAVTQYDAEQADQVAAEYARLTEKSDD